MAKKEIELIINGERAFKTVNDFDASLAKLKREAKKIDITNPEGLKQAQEYRKRIQDITEQAKAAKEQLGLMKPPQTEFQKFFGAIKEGFSALTKATFILALIQQLYEFAAAFVEVIGAVDKLRGSISQLTGLTGDALNEATAGVKALGTVYKKESDDIIQATNALAKTYNLTFNDALALVEDGFKNGADANGEFLDTLKEYPAQFKAAGISAEAAIAIISQSAKDGIFSDKGADAIKEAGLRLRELPKATEDALKPLGEAANKAIRQAIDSGDTFKAIQLVSKGLNDTGLSAKETQTIIADVFGGAGEDAGLAYLQSLQNIDVSLKDVTESTNAYTIQKNDLLQSEKELALAQSQLASVFEGLGSTLQTLTNKGLKFFAEFLIYVIDKIKFAGLIFSGFKEGIKTLFSDGDFDKGFQKGVKDSLKAQKEITEGAKKAEEERQKQLAESQKKAPVKRSVSDGETKANEEAKKKAAKEAEDAKKLAEDKVKADAEAQKKIQDLRNKAIEDENERKKAELETQIEREIAAVNATLANEELKNEQILLLRQSLFEQLAEIDLAADEARMEREEEKDLLFLETLTAELDFETQIAQERIDNEKRVADAKKTLFKQTEQDFADTTDAVIALFGEQSEAAQAAIAVLKTVQTASVIASGVAEVAAIWEKSNMNVLNAIIPGWGIAFATVQTVAAVARTAKAVASINKLADGGMLSGNSHASGGIRGTGRFGNIEVEGGEFVTNKRATANNFSAVSTLNALGDRVKFDLVPKYSFALGGQLPNTTPTGVPQIPLNTQTQDMNAIFDMLIQSNVAIKQSLDSYEREKRISLPLSDIEAAQTKKAKILDY